MLNNTLRLSPRLNQQHSRIDSICYRAICQSTRHFLPNLSFSYRGDAILLLSSLCMSSEEVNSVDKDLVNEQVDAQGMDLASYLHEDNSYIEITSSDPYLSSG